MKEFAYADVVRSLIGQSTNPKLGLTRIKQLLEFMGLVKRVPIVQVVGTNGKGSTCAFVESIAMAHGLRAGLFTSPHLCSVRERVRVNQEIISERDFVRSASRVLTAAKNSGLEPSFFECMLALALDYFAEVEVDLVILEAGLGGRLDATTSCLADVLGVASIGLDHQNILGETIEEIAKEKFAAARRGQPVVISPQDPPVLVVADEMASVVGFVPEFSPPCDLPLGLFGEHQKKNAGLAVALCQKAFPIDKAEVAQGLLNVNWAGRCETIVKNGQNILLDGAHNPHGLCELLANLEQKNYVLVFGTLVSSLARDKMELLAKNGRFTRVFIHEPKNPRAMKAEDIKSELVRLGFLARDVSIYKNFLEVERVAQDVGLDVLVTGSLYTVGGVRGEVLGIEKEEFEINY